MNPLAYQLAVAAGLRADGDAAGADALMGLTPAEVAAVLAGGPAVETFAWRPYTGPEGGRGWQSDTGEVRYQKDPPGDDDGTGGGADPTRGDVLPAAANAARVVAGAAAGGATGLAIGGPLGLAVGTVAGAALGSDFLRESLGRARAFLRGDPAGPGYDPGREGAAFAELARKVTAGDPEATQAVREHAASQMREAAGGLVGLPPADPAEVRAAWRRAAGRMRAADADELGGHVEELATARTPDRVEAAVGGVVGFLGRLTGGAMRAAFGAVKAFAGAAARALGPFGVWAGSLAVGAAVLAAPAVALGMGLISPVAAFALAPAAVAGTAAAFRKGRAMQAASAERNWTGHAESDPGPPGPPPRPGLTWRRETQRWVREDGTDEPEPPRTPDQARDLHKQLAAAHPALEDFPDAQAEAIEEYTSGAYTVINTALREGRTLQPGERGARHLTHLDAALAAAPESPVTVHRGLRFGAADGAAFLAKARELAATGGVMADPAYVSTTIDPGRAAAWVSSGTPAPVRVVMDIRARKGLYIGGSVGGVKEMEYLLPRNAPLRVTGVSERDGIYVVHAEQVPVGAGPPPKAPAPGEPGRHTFAESADFHPAGPDGKRAAQLLATSQAAGVRTLQEVADRAVRRLLMLPNPQNAAHLFEDDELSKIAGTLAGSIATADLLGRSRVRRRAEMAERVQRFAEESDPGPPGPAPRPGLTWKRETQRWVRKGADHAKELTRRAKEVPAKLRTKVRGYVQKKYDKLAQRYGEKGAKAVLAASLLMLPVPLPGASFVPIAVAEAVRAIGKGIDRFAEVPVSDELVAAVVEFIADLYAAAGEPAPAIDPGRVRAALERDEVDEDGVESFAEWTPYTGPEGGRGWKNAAGEVRYQEEMPGNSGPPGRTEQPPGGSSGRVVSNTESKAFKEWFGKSKVVGKDGSPLVVYHGTGADFDAFEVGREAQNPYLNGDDNGVGVFFAADRGSAEQYAGGGRVIPAYLKMEAPLRVGYTEYYDLFKRPGSAALVREELEAIGYDGIIRMNPPPFDKSPSDYIVFRPTQIKSQDNAGTFDPKNPKFRFAEKSHDDPWHDFAEPVPAVEPAAAVDYFRRLVPSLADDPGRYGLALGRHAFTLAVATEQTLLQKVKDAILTGLRTGADATPDVQDILDAAGVSPRNPAYCEMFVRTNVMDAYNSGAVAEMQTPEMQEAFPVWRYDGVLDDRTGDDHRPLIGKHFYATSNFADVRGPRVFNCRCSPTPVYRTEAADLIRAGKVERG